MNNPGEIGREAGRLEIGGHYQQAEAVLRDGLARFPENAAMAYALGILMLRLGRLDEGWTLYEARHRIAGRPGKPKLSFPEWNGEEVNSLLVLPEQGLGDQIMFSRYIGLLKSKGIAVELACSPSLARLFEPFNVEITLVDGQINIQRRDAWVMIGSLPKILGDAPSGTYLAGSKDLTGGIGIIVSGNQMPDPHRSLDDESARHLLSLPGAISLLPDHTGARDFQDTADIMAGLDLIITVDTSGAHLAGALGRPTLLLLPALADWRWGLGRQTEWYPSMKLFRQHDLGSWHPVVEEIRKFLGQ